MGIGAIEQLVLTIYEPAECIDFFIYFREGMLGLYYNFGPELWLQFSHSRLPRDTESSLYRPSCSDHIIIGAHWPCDIPNQYGRFAFVLEILNYCAISYRFIASSENIGLLVVPWEGIALPWNPHHPAGKELLLYPSRVQVASLVMGTVRLLHLKLLLIHIHESDLSRYVNIKMGTFPFWCAAAIYIWFLILDHSKVCTCSSYKNYERESMPLTSATTLSLYFCPNCCPVGGS